MCGISKDLLGDYVMLSLFLRIISDYFTRIPLPPPSGAPYPRERGQALPRQRIIVAEKEMAQPDWLRHETS